MTYIPRYMGDIRKYLQKGISQKEEEKDNKMEIDVEDVIKSSKDERVKDVEEAL